MNFNVIFKSSRSLTIELSNNDIVTTSPYSIYINDLLVESNITNNVYSIYNLEPNREYNIILVQENNKYSKLIKTDYEYVSLNVKKFGAKGDGTTLDTNYIHLIRLM